MRSVPDWASVNQAANPPNPPVVSASQASVVGSVCVSFLSRFHKLMGDQWPGTGSHPRFITLSVINRGSTRHGRMAEAPELEDRLAAAIGGNAGPLIGLGQRVGGIGVDDEAQLAFAIR